MIHIEIYENTNKNDCMLSLFTDSFLIVKWLYFFENNFYKSTQNN